MTNHDWLDDQTVTTDTRERIVAAAFRSLAEHGYEAATVKDIAHEAGVAPGLVHYYFETKEELLLAAIAYGCAQMPEPSGDPTEFAREAFADSKANLDLKTDFQRLMLDMAAVGLHNPRIAERVVEFIRQDRGYIERVARQVLAQRETRSSDEAPAIAAVVWGAIWGIALQKLLEPEFDAGAAVDALAEMALRFGPPPPPVDAVADV
jgi:AcrR family transcriptional regulator